MDESSRVASPRRYRSGAIVIDPVQRQVLVSGEPARLGARALDLLFALVDRRDRIVGKRELLDLVWPDLVVEENNLQVQVVALRKVLGVHAIATIPGRGYQFSLAVEGLEAAGAPAPSPTTANEARAIPGNLPPRSPLVGRAIEMTTVQGLVRDHPIVSVVGAGGIGKTCLALAAAATAPGRFPDGRWWIELASIVEAGQIVRTIGSVLGRNDAWSSADVLGEALGALQALVVLDNCEHLVDDIGPLVEALAARAPGVRWLVTSQESLKCHGEQVYRLGGLAIPPGAELGTATEYGAVALFVERAHAVDPRFRLGVDNLAAVIEICRQLDGIPLAIELAAARVPLLGVHGLAERLDQRFNVLSGGTRMKLRRHQTLRAALEWSYGLLPDEEQRVFRRLGVFAGGFSLELAQQLACDERIDQWQVLDLLGRLIDRSLVMADGAPRPRYSLLETTRAFALEMLATSGESATLMRRHAEVMRDYAVALERAPWTANEATWHAATHELANLRAAMDWSAAEPATQALACELHARVWPVFQRSGLSLEFIARMAALWPLFDSLPPVLAAECDFALGRLGYTSGRPECWAAARSAVVRYRALGDTDRLADALIQVSILARGWDDAAAADAALDEAETLVNAATPLLLQSRLTFARAHRANANSDFEGRLAANRQQVEMGRRSGDLRVECHGLASLGTAYLDAGRLDEAIATLTDVVQRTRELQFTDLLGFTLSELSAALALRGDDIDLLPMTREGHVKRRSNYDDGLALLAAALHHAGHGDVRRAAVLAGYVQEAQRARLVPRLTGMPAELVQRVMERCKPRLADAEFARLVEFGARLTESSAAAIAFDSSPLVDSA